MEVLGKCTVKKADPRTGTGVSDSGSNWLEKVDISQILDIPITSKKSQLKSTSILLMEEIQHCLLPIKKSKDNMGILSMISSVGKLSVFVGFCWTCPDDLASEGGFFMTQDRATCHVRDSYPFPRDHKKTCQRMRVWGVQSPRKSKVFYLGSMKPFSEGEPGSLGFSEKNRKTRWMKSSF